MVKRLIRQTTVFAAVMAALTCTARAQGAGEPDRAIVTCERPCAAVATAVSELGGEITYSFENIDAVAAAVPKGRLGDLSAAVGAASVHKDAIVARPSPIEPLEAGEAPAISLEGSALTDFVQAAPANYNYNDLLTGGAELHAAGLLGKDVVVGVIDTGVQMAAPALGPSGTGTVIGGENLVPRAADPVASATSRLNDWHGTVVSGMIAAHASFIFLNTSPFVQSLRVHAPSSVLPCPGPPFSASCPETASIVPMLGMAPASRIYALKVFPSIGGGSPESRIIAAMDRAITLRRNFDNGMPTTPVSGTGTEDDPYQYEALNIQVLNMSLGGGTLFAGQDVEDQLTEALLDAGIVVVAAAGNSGFAAMTVESPGTGLGSLTVAAASTPVHERVLRDQTALGRGLLFRPSDAIQTAYFSSRGPIADGRTGPHLTANGFASYVNAFAAVFNGAPVSCGSPNAPATGSGACASRILFVSGTSLSTPTVAGAAALLRGAVPAASAAQTRRALIGGANPSLLGDGSGPIDQGAGFLDVPRALEILHSPRRGGNGRCDEGSEQDRHCAAVQGDDEDAADEVGAGGRSVIENVRRAGLPVVQFKHNLFTAQVRHLKPGQVAQFFVPVDNRTDRLTVTISKVAPLGPQNQLFGDDLFVMGVDAPTSTAVHRIGVPAGAEGAFVNSDTTFVIDNPQTGLVRLALQGDWTNASLISAQVAVERQRNPLAPRTATGPVMQDDFIPVTVEVPAGTSQAVFEAFWRQNWGRYPTNDLDIYIFRPDGTEVVDSAGNSPGASSSSPERVVVADPPAGVWTVVINGFTIHDVSGGARPGRDQFSLRVSADGKPIISR